MTITATHLRYALAFGLGVFLTAVAGALPFRREYINLIQAQFFGTYLIHKSGDDCYISRTDPSGKLVPMAKWEECRLTSYYLMEGGLPTKPAVKVPPPLLTKPTPLNQKK